MIVAGVMSGTSADGIDVALVRIEGAALERSRRCFHASPPPTLLGHAQVSYPADVRRVVLGSMNSPRASVADLARLNFLLGDLYAEAVASAQKKLRIKADLVGCHGQTLYHQGRPGAYLGRQLAVTWQAGEASRIATRLGVPVVSEAEFLEMVSDE